MEGSYKLLGGNPNVDEINMELKELSCILGYDLDIRDVSPDVKNMLSFYILGRTSSLDCWYFISNFENKG